MTHTDLIVTVMAPNGIEMKVQTGLFINNEFVAGDHTIDMMNTATGKVICSVHAANETKINEAMAIAEKAYMEVWSKTTAVDRAQLLLRLADLMERDRDELTLLEMLDDGMHCTNSLVADVPGIAATLRYYAGYCDKIHGKVVNTVPYSFTRFEPHGVRCGILPWNFPLTMLGWRFGPALAFGNAMIIKTSEHTSLSALKVAALAKEAGFPPGVLQIVSGYGKSMGETLSHNMRISKIAFTGSNLVGHQIMKATADTNLVGHQTTTGPANVNLVGHQFMTTSGETNLKTATLELGNKSLNIVFADAEVDQAVQWAFRSIYCNQGHNCTLGNRIYVQEGVYDQFVQGLHAMATLSKSCDSVVVKTMHCPVIPQTQLNKVVGYVECGMAEKCTMYTGGRCIGNYGHCIEPTILTDLHGIEKIVREEIVGPVAVVVKFKDEEDVLKLANYTVCNHAATVHTRDIERALRVTKRLQAGTVWFNHYNVIENPTPFGVYKMTGIRRELGVAGLERYLQSKSVKVIVRSKL